MDGYLFPSTDRFVDGYITLGLMNSFRAFVALVVLLAVPVKSVAAGLGFSVSAWLGFGLLAAGAFVGFEALRGWCVMRACGFKTRL